MIYLVCSCSIPLCRFMRERLRETMPPLTCQIAFLSWLRLATYMSIVAVAILISFHLNDEPTATERHVALPFGVLFWLLGCSCLAAGLHNYIKTVNGYATRRALVQSGIGTQVVMSAPFLRHGPVESVASKHPG